MSNSSRWIARIAFALARIDLEQRREGDVLGTAQSGRRSSLKVLRAISDEDIIASARGDAVAIVERSVDLVDHPDLRAAVLRQESDEQSEYLEIPKAGPYKPDHYKY